MNKTITNEVIQKELKAELKRIKKLNKLDDYTTSDDYREPLSIEQTITVKILLSWGGGEDGFKLKFSKNTYGNNTLMSGVYYMADWGEYDQVELSEDEVDLVCDFYLNGMLPE